MFFYIYLVINKVFGMKSAFWKSLGIASFAVFPVLLPAQITPHEAASLMQKGINLGNTLEPPLEGGWNNPPAQEYYFDMYKEAGFHTVRIPVRWDEHTLSAVPFTINSSWLGRVEQIVDWALERDLFVILNAHHDDWIKQNYSNPDYRARFDSIWSQIALRFKDKSEKLLFEVLNEPYGLTKVQNDDMHTRILSIIRKTNPTRIVIIQGHNWGGSDELIAAAIPDDEYIIGSFHSYDPYLFGLEGQGLWGAAGDYSILKNKFITVKTWSDTHNIPVLLGEFGAVKTCDYNSRMKHYRAYVEFAQQYGFISCAWDDGGDFRIMERSAHKWEEVKDILLRTNALAPRNINLNILQDTLIQVTWTNGVSDADSIFIEHRVPTGVYSRIASLKGDTAFFLHHKANQDLYHHYRIIAHYNTGEEMYSQPIRILLPKYLPKIRGFFLGEPISVPGTVQAEDYDTGGEGLTFHDDNSHNMGGKYRLTEGVDIYSANNVDFLVSSTFLGEWFEHTVNSEQDNEYKIDFYLASRDAGGSFKIETGTTASKTISVPGTYSLVNTTIVSDTLFLKEGLHVIRFTVLGEPTFSIDKMVFSPISIPSDVQNVESHKLSVTQNMNRDLVLNISPDNEIQQIKLFNMKGSMIHSEPHPAEELIIPYNDAFLGLVIIQAITSNGIYVMKYMIK